MENLLGVAIGDILETLYRALRVCVTDFEWESLRPIQQDLVSDAFRLRVHGSSKPLYESAKGVRRIDWLLANAQFVGFAPCSEPPFTWTLITKRLRTEINLSRNIG